MTNKITLSIFYALFLFIATQAQSALAQICPPNLGFESGTFDGWTRLTGFISQSGVITLDPASVSVPDMNRHKILQNKSPQDKDPYGGFPVNCPNGSGYSIRLGNDDIQAQAESISYTVLVPADNNDFILTYYYAVVLENPGHLDFQQPRFMSAVEDLNPEISSGYKSSLSCANHLFVASSGMPGFVSKDTVIFRGASSALSHIEYKDWAPVSIHLQGYAGHQIKLTFTTTDCTQGGHFGYAYLDFDQNCSSSIISGGSVCNNSQTVNLSALPGYEKYAWYNTADFTAVLGEERSLQLSPIPPDGTKYALVAKPYGDAICLDTIYTTIQRVNETLNLVTNPAIFCAGSSTDITTAAITSGSSPGLKLEYFEDANAEKYISDPKRITKPGTYYILATNSYGCIDMKPVVVSVSSISYAVADPDPVIFPATVNIKTAHAPIPNVVFTYWRDENTSIPVDNSEAVSEAGIYYIKATSNEGVLCEVIKPVRVIIYPPPAITVSGTNAFSPNGDGVNDVFSISAEGIYKFNFIKIFNRYGETIFQSFGQNLAWDGNINGKTAPTGTYYWMFNCYDLYNKKELSQSGSVTVIR